MKTVIYHSADFDGIFCREIAKHFLGPGNADDPNQYIGWNFGDPRIVPPDKGEIYILDLSPDCLTATLKFYNQIIWIDHHKTSIEKWTPDFAAFPIKGYRIDGVAACRLAWQWFALHHGKPLDKENEPYFLPQKQDFIDRKVSEPLAVRLAGEYDIWDKRDWRTDPLQYGLRASEDGDLKPCEWDGLLSDKLATVNRVVERGMVAQSYARNVDASICNSQTWIMEWEGLKFLCVNHARFNSLLFTAKDVPETGHDALLGFRFDGKNWLVSLYHAAHRKDLDLSTIAAKHGGGGHRGACGFTCETLPFYPGVPWGQPIASAQ